MTPSRDPKAPLLRLDLIRAHWLTYLSIAVATIAIHWLFVARFGLSTSTDFSVRYDPGARALLALLGVGTPDAGAVDPIGTYGWSRIGYIAFVALGYSLWGIGNWVAVVHAQLGLVWIAYPLVFHVLLHVTSRYWLSVGAILVWLTFLDGYQWHPWALPDALYRLMFVAGFFLLFRLWETGRELSFLAATFVLTIVGVAFRLETVLYALPAYWVSSQILRRRYPVLMLAAVALVAAAAWSARAVIGALIQFASSASQGIIFAGLGYHIDGVTRLIPPAEPTVASWTVYYLHLYGARLWYSMTPFPAFWSRSHQIYYALYVIPSYVLIVIGLRDPELRRDRMFQFCIWMFAAGVLVRLMLHVDPPLRYAYTPQVFQYFAAALACPAAYRAWQHRRGSARAGVV